MIPCATCESLLCVGRIVSILEQLHEQKANQSVVIISFILYFLYGVVIGSGVKLIGSSPDPRFSFLVSGLCSMFILYYIENRPSLWYDILTFPQLLYYDYRDLFRFPRHRPLLSFFLSIRSGCVLQYYRQGKLEYRYIYKYSMVITLSLHFICSGQQKQNHL